MGVKTAIVTNVELDHVDYYKDYQHILSCFQKFVNNSEKIINFQKKRDRYARMCYNNIKVSKRQENVLCDIQDCLQPFLQYSA